MAGNFTATVEFENQEQPLTYKAMDVDLSIKDFAAAPQ
jgi:hypothetical protein